MTSDVTLALVDTNAAGWPAELDRLRSILGAPHNPTLFPAHFLSATLPKIGGGVVTFRRGDRLVAVGFIFPRALRDDRRIYTMRFHPVDGSLTPASADRLSADVGRLLGGGHVVCYDPTALQGFIGTSRGAEVGVVLAPPTAADAEAIPRLQAAIWGATSDFLYPADLHSEGFAPGSTLVARLDGKTVGFLFGFAKFGGSQLPDLWEQQFGGDFRVESQLLGVVPEARQHGVGQLLKLKQGINARQQGIGFINWTVDPLQYGNAVLNFGRLKAVAFDFYPDHYGFRNELNQVAASRFGISWPMQTARVEQALTETIRATIVDLRDDTTIPRANSGYEDLRLDLDAPTIAIEVPADWTALQRTDLAAATRWRVATDAIFARYLGSNLGQYAVVGVARDEQRRYLLAERITTAWLEEYGAW